MLLRKILVVEDSELLHHMYDLVLMRYRAQGTEVLHARDGKQALAMLDANPDTDLILLDLVMPVMGGLDFLKARRSGQTHEKIPVVICTTRGREEDIQTGLREGAAAYLTKPIQPGALSDVMKRLIGWAPGTVPGSA